MKQRKQKKGRKISWVGSKVKAVFLTGNKCAKKAEFILKGHWKKSQMKNVLIIEIQIFVHVISS